LANDIPSYVWYLKDNDTHGERFMISLGDIKWKSTSSKKLSLRYKLEETKKYLRALKNNRPDLFTDYSMNGDLNQEGKINLESFINIAKNSGYSNINNIVDKTNQYLKEKHTGLSNQEIELLNLFEP
jgi:hypothetical protein